MEENKERYAETCKTWLKYEKLKDDIKKDRTEGYKKLLNEVKESNIDLGKFEKNNSGQGSVQNPNLINLYWVSIELKEEQRKEINDALGYGDIKEYTHIYVLPYSVNLPESEKLNKNTTLELDEFKELLAKKNPEDNDYYLYKTQNEKKKYMKIRDERIEIDTTTGNFHPFDAMKKVISPKIRTFILVSENKKSEKSKKTHKGVLLTSLNTGDNSLNYKGLYKYTVGRKDYYIPKKCIYALKYTSDKAGKEELENANVAFINFLKKIGVKKTELFLK